MRALINQYSGAHYLGFFFINTVGQLFDALLIFYFMSHILSPKTGRRLPWGWAAFLMTGVTCLADHLSGNNPHVWTGVIILFPLCYGLLFYREDWRYQLVICLLGSVVLSSLENVSVSLTNLCLSRYTPGYVGLLFLYALRRFLMKGVLFLALSFLLKKTSPLSGQRGHASWYALGITSLAEIWLMFFFRDHGQGLWEGLVLSLFCLFVPILYYVMLNLTEDNAIKEKTALVQKNQIAVQEQYLDQVMQMQDSLRKFRHDYRSHLFCMDGLLQEERYDELRAYLQDLHKMDKALSYGTAYTGNHRLNILLNQKKAAAVSRGVELDIKVEDCPPGAISAYDLNVILSNLCDNAIEAAALSEEKKALLVLKKTRSYLDILVQNTTPGNVLKDNPQFLTSKADAANHGYGTRIVQSLIEKYEGIQKIDGGEGWLKMRILLLNT